MPRLKKKSEAQKRREQMLRRRHIRQDKEYQDAQSQKSPLARVGHDENSCASERRIGQSCCLLDNKLKEGGSEDGTEFGRDVERRRIAARRAAPERESDVALFRGGQVSQPARFLHSYSIGSSSAAASALLREKPAAAAKVEHHRVPPPKRPKSNLLQQPKPCAPPRPSPTMAAQSLWQLPSSSLALTSPTAPLKVTPSSKHNTLDSDFQTFHALLASLRERNLFSYDAYNLFKYTFSSSMLKSLKLELDSLGNDASAFSYSGHMRRFATMLYFHSPNMYDSAQSVLDLPSVDAIHEWMASSHVMPGILEAATTLLREQVGKHDWMKDCTVLVGEMPLRKGAPFDAAESLRVAGGVDYGQGNLCEDLLLASRALVFMVSGLKGYWKIPVAFFLTGSGNAVVTAGLLKAVLWKLKEVGLRVRSVVLECDWSSLETIASLSSSSRNENLTGSFVDSSSNSEIHVVFDMGGLIHKLTDTFQQLREFGIDKQLGAIRWDYIEKLYVLVYGDDRSFENLPDEIATQWEQHKRRVKCSTAVFSESVAAAINFARDDLHLRDFHGSQLTARFVRLVTRVMGVHSSKNPLGKGFCSPLRASTQEVWMLYLQETLDILRGLKDPCGYPLVNGRHRIAVLGLCINIQSIINLSRQFLWEEHPCGYLLTHAMSLEHLNHFFRNISARVRNRPTTLQFKTLLLKLLPRYQIPFPAAILYDDDLVSDDREEFKLLVNHRRTAPSSLERALCTTYVAWKHRSLAKLDYLDIVSDDALLGIHSFVAKEVNRMVKCETCRTVLYSLDVDQLPTESRRASMKIAANLFRPSRSVCEVLKATERVARRNRVLRENRMPNEQKLVVQIQVLEELQDKTLFSDMGNHIFNHDPVLEECHLYKLVRLLSTSYVQLARLGETRDRVGQEANHRSIPTFVHCKKMV